MYKEKGRRAVTTAEARMNNRCPVCQGQRAWSGTRRSLRGNRKRGHDGTVEAAQRNMKTLWRGRESKDEQWHFGELTDCEKRILTFTIQSTVQFIMPNTL